MMKNGIEQHLELTVVLPAIAGIGREHYHAAPFNRHLDDRRAVFYLARTPIETLGMPRMVRGGLRFNLAQ